MCSQAVETLSVKRHRAGVRLQLTSEDIHRGALARPIGTKQTNYLTCSDREIKAAEGRLTLIGVSQVPRLKAHRSSTTTVHAVQRTVLAPTWNTISRPFIRCCGDVSTGSPERVTVSPSMSATSPVA